MKSGTYEGVWSCMHNIRSVTVKVFLRVKEKFLICSFESQDGGKKGIAENREEDQIIYLTTVLKEKSIFNDV
jgi:hypothetical protein